jgi:hypothetical protein
MFGGFAKFVKKNKFEIPRNSPNILRNTEKNIRPKIGNTVVISLHYEVHLGLF